MTDHDYTSEDISDDGTILAQLRKAVEQKIKREDIFINVPERDNVLIRISPNINQKALAAWRKNAGMDTKKGMSTVNFSANVIAATCTGISFNGEIVRDDAGNDVTFASQEVMEMTGTTKPHPDCVLALYGLEPHVEAAAVAIIEASGWGDAVDTVDPLKPSSTN